MRFDVEKFVAGLHDYLGKALSPLGKRMKELEARMDAVEKGVADFSYKGTWSASDTYGMNNAVTFDGSLWICRTKVTRQQPATGTDWKLAVRKGRDGRDGRSAA